MFLFLIETKNRTLEETAALFDGEDAMEQIVHTAEDNAVNAIDIREDDDKGSRSSYVPDHAASKA